MARAPEPRRIQLIVTGDLELRLPEALQRVFPSDEVVFLPAEKVMGFTSAQLAREVDTDKALKAESLVARMLAAIDPGKRGKPADFAIGLDDVELANLGNEKAIWAHVVAAAKVVTAREYGIDQPDHGRGRLLRRRLNTEERRRDAMRKCCSFHLLSPMIEGPLFADIEAIRAARPSPPLRDPRFDPTAHDPEDFLVIDSSYTDPPDDFMREGAAFPARWARPQRDRHPKHYIEFLLDPEGQMRRPYRESEEGRRTLEAFSWERATKIPDHLPRLRALLHDIADMAGLHPEDAWGPAPKLPHRVFRNK